MPWPLISDLSDLLPGVPLKEWGWFVFQPWKGCVFLFNFKVLLNLEKFLFNFNFCLFSLGRLFQPQNFFRSTSSMLHIKRLLPRTSKFLFNIGRLPKSWVDVYNAKVCVSARMLITVVTKTLVGQYPFSEQVRAIHGQVVYQVSPPFCLCFVLCNSGLGWCLGLGNKLWRMRSLLGTFFKKLRYRKHGWSNSGSSSLVLAHPVLIFRL